MTIAAATLATAQQHIAAGRLEEAKAVLLRLAQRHGTDPAVVCMLSYVLGRRGEYEQARFHLERALRASPNEGALLINYGQLLAETGKPKDAVPVLERAVSAAPGIDAAWVNLVNALLKSRRYASAAACCREGLKRFPGHERLTRYLAIALLSGGEPEAAAELMRGLVRQRPGNLAAAAMLAYTLNFIPGMKPADVLAAHRAYGLILDRTRPAAPEGVPAAADASGRARRVGMIGGDFFTHSVAFFVEPLLERRDRSRFHVTLYHTATNTDHTSERFKGLADVWRHVAWTDDVALVKQIRDDRIDVLIDLAGHTANNRLGVLHLRAAPLQMTYCGYPATTGVSAVDVRIVDSLTDPAPGAESAATERLARLDPCFLCYRPVQAAAGERAPEVSPPPSAGGGPVTFGSFNALSKLNARVIEVWRRVLDAVPGSRLLLKSVGLSEAEVREKVAARFAAAGVGPDRLELLASVPTLTEHLSLYSRIDIALDNFPYHGTTTTCEALYMGVPVVTLASEPGIHAGRVGVSLLNAVGLGELVAHSEEEYISIAAGLARDAARLGEIRAGLRERLLASPLCDAEGFAKRFWGLVEGEFARVCSGTL